MNPYLLGACLVLLGGTCLSLSGIIVRNMDFAEGWQILFYRSQGSFLVVLAYILFKYRQKTVTAFLQIGSSGLVAGVVLGLGSISYLFALLHTTVANVAFLIGASPLFAALGGWLFLKEKPSFSNFILMILVFGGVGLMIADGYVTGGLLGNIFAMGAVLSGVTYILLVRNGRDIDMVPATCLASVITLVISGYMAESWLLTPKDMILSLILGSLQFGMGFLLLTLGAKYIPAADTALFALSESILNPLWVWLFINEVPTPLSLLGSAIVLICVVSYSLNNMRMQRMHN